MLPSNFKQISDIFTKVGVNLWTPHTEGICCTCYISNMYCPSLVRNSDLGNGLQKCSIGEQGVSSLLRCLISGSPEGLHSIPNLYK